MLTLPEYLIQYEKKHLIKISMWLILFAISIISVWASSMLEDNFLSTIPVKILWSVLLVLCLISLILYSYIKYVYKESNVKLILKNYSNDEKYGIPKHKKDNYLICPQCLINNKIEYQVKEYSKYCLCTICDKKYYFEEEKWGDLSFASFRNDP